MMSEKYYKVLRSGSLSHLHQLLMDARMSGWEPVGDLDLFDGVYVQPIKKNDYEDDTTEIITVEMNRY